MPGRPTVDCRATVSGNVLGNVGCRFPCPQVFDKVFRVIALVAGHGDPPFSGNVGNHFDCGFPLRSTSSMGDGTINDEAVSILHQGMAQVAHLGLFACAFLVESGIRVCRGLMGFVLSVFPTEVMFLVPTNGVLRSVLRLEAFGGSPCFDKSTVNTEVLVG